MTPASSGWTHLAGGADGGIGVLLLARKVGWTVPGWDWVLVASLGGAVSIGELASRYRDAPIKAILSVPATIYVLLNATAAVTALVLGRHFELWAPVAEAAAGTAAGSAVGTAAGPVAWSQVLAAGLGAMVLLRSSVFQIRVNGQDVGVGPSSFLQSVIDAADRAVDRLRAQERAYTVARVMEGVSSEKALKILPAYISALMQNIMPEEQGIFDEKVERLISSPESEQVKSHILGLLAMNYTGEAVLRAAVASLAAEIRDATEATSDAAARTVVAARRQGGDRGRGGCRQEHRDEGQAGHGRAPRGRAGHRGGGDGRRGRRGRRGEDAGPDRGDERGGPGRRGGGGRG